MKNKKVILLLFSIAAFLSFSLMDGSDRSISILESSEKMQVSKISLEDQKTLLKSGESYEFYVEVKAKNVKGKEVKNYKKVKRRGVRYILKYTYKYLPSQKKMYDKQDFIIWNDGQIENWKSSDLIVVEGIRLKTQINH